VPVPALVASDASARVPFVVTEHVPGASGVTMLADPHGAAALGREMGRLARRVASVPTEGLRLPGTWSRPADLARTAGLWLGRAGLDLPRDVRDELSELIDAIPDTLAGRPAVLAHGDWAPVNVVVDGGVVVAVVDWESARLADPLFDAAWWGALVFLFHRDAWGTAWPAFLSAAGLRLDAPTMRRLRILGPLRVLEVLASARVRRDPVAREAWAGRLVRLLDTSEDAVQPQGAVRRG
jgi:aminoglycoside phosphotransferase (APT) family kinase protein